MSHRCNAAIALGFAVVSACATGGVRQVSVTTGDELDPSEPLAKMSMYVVPNTKMTDTLLEARIRAHVEEALLEKGYTLVAPTLADVYVMASFGAVDEMGLTTLSVLPPPQTRVIRAANGTVIRRVYPERIEHEKVFALISSVAVLVSASDAKLFRETGQVRIIWRGEATTPGKPELVHQMVPYLLASTLKYFGKSSGGAQSVEIKDKEIKDWLTAR